MWEKGGHFPKESIHSMNGKWHFSTCFPLMWLLKMVNISLYFVFPTPMCFCFPYKSCWIVTNPLFTKFLTMWHTLQVFSLVNTCLWVIMTYWYYKNQLKFSHSKNHQFYILWVSSYGFLPFPILKSYTHGIFFCFHFSYCPGPSRNNFGAWKMFFGALEFRNDRRDQPCIRVQGAQLFCVIVLILIVQGLDINLSSLGN